MSRYRRKQWEKQAKLDLPKPPAYVESFFPNTQNTSGVGYLVTWASLKRAVAKDKPIKAGTAPDTTKPEPRTDNPDNGFDAGLFR